MEGCLRGTVADSPSDVEVVDLPDDGTPEEQGHQEDADPNGDQEDDYFRERATLGMEGGEEESDPRHEPKEVGGRPRDRGAVYESEPHGAESGVAPIRPPPALRFRLI